MAKTNKTIETDASVEAHLAAIADAARRADCRALVALMSAATGQPPRMWGAAIVGFGSYHYRYASGREGDAPLVGFSSRKGDISVYLTAAALADDALLDRLGRHKAGKGCLYLRALDDIDREELARLVADAVAERARGG